MYRWGSGEERVGGGPGERALTPPVHGLSQGVRESGLAAACGTQHLVSHNYYYPLWPPPVHVTPLATVALQFSLHLFVCFRLSFFLSLSTFLFYLVLMSFSLAFLYSLAPLFRCPISSSIFPLASLSFLSFFLPSFPSLLSSWPS